MWDIIIIVAAIATSVFSQSYNYRSSQDAAILSDARYLSGDGTFGAAYSQEDGVQFKEESDVNGDRKGSYSYVDPTGHRRTVFYTAGKNGFQVRDEFEAIGDHIPTARPVVAPQPEYEPLPQYNPPDYQPPQRQYRAQAQPQSQYDQESIDQPEPQPQYYSKPQYRPPPTPPQSQYRPEPQPQYRPQPRPLYRPPPQPTYQTEPQNQPRSQYQPQPSPRPRPQYQPQPSPQPRPQYNEITTPTPRRFHPLGKLDFNRTPDGFSYTYSKS